MTYFTISELTASDTAKAKGIDNSPTTAVRANLVALIETLLDPLREACCELLSIFVILFSKSTCRLKIRV